MPTFSFKNKTTEEEISVFMSNAEREAFLVENPDWFQTITSAPALGDPVHLGVKRTDEAFNDALKYISKRNDNRKNKSEMNFR